MGMHLALLTSSVLALAPSDAVLHRPGRDPTCPVRASQLQRLRPLLCIRGAEHRGSPRVVRSGLVPLDIRARATRVLERRVPPILDGIQHSQLYPRIAHFVERLCILRVLSLPSTPHISALACSPLDLAPRDGPLYLQTCRVRPTFAFSRTVTPPTRPPRARDHPLAHLERTCTNRAPRIALASARVLGGCATTHRAPLVGQSMDYVERRVGCGELCALGGVSSASVMCVGTLDACLRA